MRQLVTGIDADGRSCIASEKVIEASDEIAVETPYETPSAPPPRPVGNADSHDVALAPGAVRVLLVQWPAGFHVPMHHTDSVDVNTVVAGSIDLLLDDGPHTLHVGDTAVVTGVDHGWTAGPDGATTTGVLLGTPVPA